MANPFGEVIDNEKLEELERYKGKRNTQEDRAREAMRLMDDGGKRTDAEKYVKDVKEDYGNGVSCLIRLYNATGDTLYYAGQKDWLGYIGRTPYPTRIGNGQWASFLHVHRTSASTGAEAAVVYRGKNKDGIQRDFMIAWAVPWGPWYKNKAYSETGYVESFEGRWSDVYKKLNNSGYSDTTNRDGIIIDVDIEKGTSPEFNAIIKIPFTS